MKARLVMLVLAVAFSGCGDSAPSARSSSGAAAEGFGVLEAEIVEGVEVPDVSFGDGADAVSQLESEGFTVTLADAEDDLAFDPSRDATACEVEDQEPAAGEILAEGEEVTVTVSCAQVDWGNREGTAWESFDAAYTSGFDAGCDALFNESPNGSLYEDDYEYTAVDCQNENSSDASETPDVPADVPDDPDAAGTEAGELGGCRALFGNQGVHSLDYGEQSWTELDCPISTGVVAPTMRKKTPERSTAKGAGESCKITQTDGATMTIEVGDGRVNCTGAEALWNEYLRRAPNEGVGLGAAVELDGWACVAAPAAQTARGGSCSATDGTGSFTITADA